MQLLIDCGNRYLKWRTLPTHRSGRIDHRNSLSPLRQAWHELPPIQQVWIASVASRATAATLQQLIESQWGCPLHWVTASAHALGVRNGYRNPKQLGVDRWLGLLAAPTHIADTAKAALIADCGTAVTLDLLTAEGEHHPGPILPGLDGCYTCLLATTNIPNPPAEETEQAMRAGAKLALSAAIDRYHRQWRERLPAGVQLLLTGGDAPTLLPHLEEPGQWLPELLLDGLARLAQAHDV